MPPIPPLFTLPIEPNGRITWYVLSHPIPSFKATNAVVFCQGGTLHHSALTGSPLAPVPKLRNSVLIFSKQSQHPTFSPPLSSYICIAPRQPPDPLLLPFVPALTRYTRSPFSKGRCGYDVGDTEILQQRIGLRERGEGWVEVLGWKFISTLAAAIDVRPISTPKHGALLSETGLTDDVHPDTQCRP